MKPWAALTPRLDILDKKDKKLDAEDILAVRTDNLDDKNSYSRKIIAALPLSSKIHRDLAIDYMNPREELAQYIKTEDTIPAFDMSTLTLIRPEDSLAKNQIGLIKQSIESWSTEENKYNPGAPDPVKGGVSNNQPISAAKWNKILEQNLKMQYQTALDQTSSL